MKKVKVYQYDVFSKKPNKGNPAGVVLNRGELTDEEMQEIAFKVGFNETAFPVKSEVADFGIRFTPKHEMNLCGHGTIAMVSELKTKGLLDNKTNFTIETKAGILPIKILSTHDDEVQITMGQATPQFQQFTGSKEKLAASIGLKLENLDEHFPILYGSTGTWTLLIPIKQLDVFTKMKPNNQMFPNVLKEMPGSSVHPFCLETYDPDANMRGRHFSSPFSGTIEDPVTGTASGVMGAYYARYIKNNNFGESLNLIIEQGQKIQKDGRVLVHISKNHDSYNVEIIGSTVYVKEFEVLL